MIESAVLAQVAGYTIGHEQNLFAMVNCFAVLVKSLHFVLQGESHRQHDKAREAVHSAVQIPCGNPCSGYMANTSPC